MFRRIAAAALVIFASLSLIALPVSAHTGTVMVKSTHSEACGWANTAPDCKTTRVRYKFDHGVNLSGCYAPDPNNQNNFCILATIVNESNLWAGYDQVNRMRICLGYNGMGVLACDDRTVRAEDGGIDRVGLATYSDDYAVCGFYIQTEAWGVNFHMPFTTNRFPGC